MNEQVPSLEMPRGHVTVELIDPDRDKVIERVEADNFLTGDTIEVARWFQRMMWYIFHPDTTSVDSVGALVKAMPRFPADHIAYWNDTAAEDPVNDNRLKGLPVGWASRHPVGSPTGKRGVVDIGASTISPTQAKWVFNWGTAQGNGTFQSVGWTRLLESNTDPLPIGRYPEPGAFAAAVNTTSMVTTPSGFYHDGTQWIVVDAPALSSQCRLSIISDPGNVRSDLFSLGTAWDSSAEIVNGICKLGTDWYISGYDTTGTDTGQVSKYNSAGTHQWTVDIVSTTRLGDITTDGTHLFVGNRDAGNIYKLDPSNGSQVSTITVSALTAVTAVEGIAYDAADGNFWIRTGTTTLRKMQPDGTVIDAFSIIASQQTGIASTTPFVGSYTVGSSNYTDSWLIGHNVSVDTTAGTFENKTEARFGSFPVINGGDPAPLTFKGTTLWAGIYTGSQTRFLTPVVGHNLATRVLLPSPVTKLNTQNLRITYQFDFS